MRDQVAVGVHDVGVAGLADLDLRDHVPDELEVDLRHRHPGLVAAAAQRDGDVRLGLLAEVDEAEVGLALLGIAEARVLGEIRPAAHHVHGEAGDAELLLPRRVDVADLGDRRHLAEEAEVVSAPLLHGRRGSHDGRLGRPADLALDFLDELLDAGGSAERLFALERHERLLVLLVGEVDLERAAGDELHR